MAEKRYYWLKLKEDYFNNPKIKKLRKIAGGDTYTVIYLEMQLLSIQNGGIIQFENIEPTLEEELALKLDEDIDNVKVTLAYLESQGLIDINENNECMLIETTKMIGSESESADRVRRFRERQEQKALQCNGDVTNVYISNSISNSNIYNIKESKHKYGEYKHILLTDKELSKLNEDYGEEETQQAIKYLDEYIEMKGAKYKSHNLALRKWVFDALKERKQKERPQKEDMYSQLDRVFREIDV